MTDTHTSLNFEESTIDEALHPAVIVQNHSENTPILSYEVAMPQPQTHLFEVTLKVKNCPSPLLNLKLPVWTPGSYLVREYAKHLQDFTALAGERVLNSCKVTKNHWQVDTNGVTEVTIKYRIFANEISVRTNHLDITHGYFNGAAMFLRIPDWEKQEINVTIVPPYPDWKVTAALPMVSAMKNTFYAKDYDTLVDTPFEIGKHQVYEFEVLGKSHELAIWGQGNFQVQRLIDDFEKIIEVEAEIFGGLPYERYIFLLHLLSQAFGGLEHKDSCSLIYQRFGFKDTDKYERFIQLVAHEFFHLWNVKRIRPEALEIFDYDQENYTTSLWFCEGTTSYYDLHIPLRAGIYNAKSYLNHLSKEVTRYQNTPGKSVQVLSESSFDTWIKLYRPDANSPNSQISYYLKGEMVSLLLDLLIRARHDNMRSLDDVMRLMWQQFGEAEVGYTPKQLQAVIESVAGVDLTNFFEQYIDGLVDLPFNQYLELFGLQLLSDADEEPFLGIKVASENNRDIVKFVEALSPAQMAGIDTGDELIAINGIKVSATSLSERLRDFQAKDVIKVTVFHQDELFTYDVTLTHPRMNKYAIKPIANPSKAQKKNLTGWLGTSVMS